MAENTTTPVEAPAAPPVTSPTLAVTTPEAQAADGQHDTISLEEARKLRSEAQSLRKRMKAYEDAEEQAKLTALSDVEKATKRANEAEQRIKAYQEKLIHAEVKIAAQAKGIIDPDLAAMAIKSSLEYDEEGMPSNLDKALDLLIKNKPYLAPKPAEPPAPEPTPAAPVVPAVPATPAMNPGRTNILQPGAGMPGKVPTWGEAYGRKAQ